MKREKVSAFFKSKGFYVSLFAGIFAVFVLTMVYANVNSIKRQSEDELAKQDTPGNLAEVNPAGEGAIGVKDTSKGSETGAGQQTAKNNSTGSQVSGSQPGKGEVAQGDAASQNGTTQGSTPQGGTAQNGGVAQGSNGASQGNASQSNVAQGGTQQGSASQDGEVARGNSDGMAQGNASQSNVAQDGTKPGASQNGEVAKESDGGTLAKGDGQETAKGNEASDGSGQDLAANLELESEYGEVASAEGITESDAAPVTSVQPDQNILQNLHFQEENGLLWPAEGAIIKNYSMEKLVYFETLEQFKCNPAVMIGLEVGSDVLCGAKGVVTAITETEELGNSILVDIGDGYQLRYAQLADLHVQVGDVVEEGTVLAQVAEPTIYYSKEGSNLYFQVLQDGESVNPLLLLR